MSRRLARLYLTFGVLQGLDIYTTRRYERVGMKARRYERVGVKARRYERVGVKARRYACLDDTAPSRRPAQRQRHRNRDAPPNDDNRRRGGPSGPPVASPRRA